MLVFYNYLSGKKSEALSAKFEINPNAQNSNDLNGLEFRI